MAVTCWLAVISLVPTRVAAQDGMVNCSFIIKTWNRAPAKLERKAPYGEWIRTPLNIRLPEGTWTFRASAPGCVSQTLTTTLRPPRFSHTFVLPPPKAYVKVEKITPSDAGLMLDGRPIRAGEWVNVSPGSHTITSKLESSFRYPFTVSAEERKSIREIIVPVRGKIKVTIDPPVVEEITLEDRADNSPHPVPAGRECSLPRGRYLITANLPEGCSLLDPEQTVNVQPGPVKDVVVRIRTPWFCDECQRYFVSQAALDAHLLTHTGVIIEKIEPADAELVLDGRTPIRPGEKKPVTPGRHWITGESPRGYLKDKDRYEFSVLPGETKRIPLIEIPNVPPTVIIGKVEPDSATTTVNGKPAKANSIIEVKPEGRAESVKVNVTVTKDDYETWTQESDLKWKEEWKIPDPLVLTRLRWAKVCLTVNPKEMDEYTHVWIVDAAGSEQELKHGRECTRVDLSQKGQTYTYTVKVKPPADYRLKEPIKPVIVKDHETTPLLVELVKKEGRLKLSFDPKPVVVVSVYDEHGKSRGTGDCGDYCYTLVPDVQHVFVCTASGFEDTTLKKTLAPGEELTETVTMEPRKATLQLTTRAICRDDATLYPIVQITDPDGKLLIESRDNTAERKIALDPEKDGSDKLYHYRVFRDGFRKDLHTADWQGDIVAQRGKTIQLDKMVLKCIRQVLEEEAIPIETNPCEPRGYLTSEELDIAARLADDPTIKDSYVKHGWGCKWRDVAGKCRERAANLRFLLGCVMENDPCVPREGLTLEQLQRATKLAETLSYKDCEVRPGCGCTWGEMAKKFRQGAEGLRARVDTGGSK